MKNLIFILCLFSASVPLVAEVEGTSPMMMLSRTNEKSSACEKREIPDDEVRGVEGGSAAQRLLSPETREERMQQSLDLQLLTSIAQKMEAQMQQVLDGMDTKQGTEKSLTSSNQRGVMSLEEESFLKTITEDVTDQTRNLMTQEQINNALMQEQERTLNALEAYYQLERSHDETFSEEAIEPLEDHEQIKENLISAIRHAFITMQRAYCSGSVLPQAVESIWRCYQARESLSEQMIPSFMPTYAQEEAINDAQLRSAIRVAYQTDQEVQEGLARRGYASGKPSGNDVPELAPADALDQRADQETLKIGSIYGLDKTRTQKEEAFERYQQMKSRGVASASKASPLSAPAAASEEQEVHGNLLTTVRENVITNASLNVLDEMRRKKQEALERYQAMMNKK